MSGSINKVILIGNLCSNPEVRSFTNGGKVCGLRIATNETWRDKNSGERREKAEYHTVDIFNEGLVKVAEQYLHKGSKVYIEGKLSTRKWQDQSGNDRYSTSVVLQGFEAKLVMLDGASGDRDGRSGDSGGGSSGYGNQGGSSGGSGYGGGNHGSGGAQAPDRNQGGGGSGYGGNSDGFGSDDIPFAPEWRI